MNVPGMRREPRGLPRVLIADQNDANVMWLAESLAGQCELYKVPAGAKIPASLAGLAPHILIVGSSLRDMPGANLLAQLPRMNAPAELVTMFMVDKKSSAPIPDEESLYYVLSREMSAADVQAIVASAVVRRSLDDDEAPTAAEAARLARMLEVPRQFAAQRDLRGAASVAIRAMTEFIDADRADCLFYDPDDGSLWSEGGDGEAKWQGSRESSARTGLAGFAARTGQALCLERSANDSRYHRETDDPTGRGNERILVQPLEGNDGQVHAVLIAVRAVHREAFSRDDVAVSAWLAKQLAPLTAQLAMQIEAESVLEEAAEEPGMFRREAALAHASVGKRGDVVRVSPRWISWSYWLLVLILGVGAVFAFVANIPDYSSGPAVISQSGRSDILAPVSGNLVAVHVEPGEDVVAGQLLATFSSPDESSQLSQLDKEWQTSLRAYLSNRADVAARSAVAALRSQRDRMIEKLTVRAVHAGKVADLSVAPGQRVAVGDAVLSIARAGGALTVIALLPGADRPQIRKGMSVRLTVDGYQRSHVDLIVESVGNDVIGPAEAERSLGRRLAGSIRVPGSVVLVRAVLSDRTFEVEGDTYEYGHGMTGLAEVELRSESVIRTLIPGLKRR